MTMVEEVKLFGLLGSRFCCRVEIALRLKGVQYEFEEENPYHNKSPLLLKYNPVHKKVPILLHNGRPIVESLVIVEYIDETWKDGYPILPKDPYERAMVRFWAKFIDEKCLPALREAALKKDKEQEEAVEKARELLKTLESELIGKKFFGGDSIGFVDIVASFTAFLLLAIQEVTGVEVLTREKFPKLCEWNDEFVKCSAVKECLPSREVLIPLFESVIQAVTAVQ